MHRHFLPKGFLIPFKFFTNSQSSPAILRRYILQLYPALEFLFLTEDAVPSEFPSVTIICESDVKLRLRSIVSDQYAGAFPLAKDMIGTSEQTLLKKHDLLLTTARGRRDALSVDVVEELTAGAYFQGRSAERNATIYVASLILYHLNQKALAGNPPLPSEGGDTEPPLMEQLSLDPIEALQPRMGTIGSFSECASVDLPTSLPEF